jgi:hypothetical protein
LTSWQTQTQFKKITVIFASGKGNLAFFASGLITSVREESTVIEHCSLTDWFDIGSEEGCSNSQVCGGRDSQIRPEDRIPPRWIITTSLIPGILKVLAGLLFCPTFFSLHF